MIESQQVLEWMAQGELRGKLEGQTGTLLLILADRFGQISSDLAKSIQSQEDSDKLNSWVRLAVNASTIDDFVHQANV